VIFGKVQFSIVEGHFEKHILKIRIFVEYAKENSIFHLTKSKKKSLNFIFLKILHFYPKKKKKKQLMSKLPRYSLLCMLDGLF
jgi:hypothetical protein